MPLTLRADKGSRLTNTEVDANFVFLDTTKQAASQNLTALSSVIGAANKAPYFTAAGAMAVYDLTVFGRSLTAAADAAAARTALGLGNAATRTALGTTGGLYSRDSILGTVSQSGGIPTGAIIERGSNANGEYVRFADGTQICSGRLSGGLGSATAHGSSLYIYLKLLTWPASFSGIPTLSGYGVDNINVGIISGYNLGLYSAHLVYITPNASVIDTYIGWIAIGRWY